MNGSALAAISQLVGAAAVVVSPLYSAAQVKASTRQARHLRREGSLDAESWAAVERIIRDWMALPGVQLYFRDRRGWYTTSFLGYVAPMAGGGILQEPGKSIRDHYGDRVAQIPPEVSS